MPDQPTADACRFAPDYGAWIKRRHFSEHRCLLPELNQGLRDLLVEGDQWQCHDCRTVWTVRPDPISRLRQITRWRFRKTTEVHDGHAWADAEGLTKPLP